jgi:potassium efflux system protein
MAYSYPNAGYSDSLGRLSLIILMLGLAVFSARVLSPRRGALQYWLAEHQEGWLSRLRNVWYPLVVAIPLTLAALAAVGYLYTVGVLLQSLISSMYLLLGLIVAYQFIIRWLALTRRRLALQAALERRVARVSEQAGPTGQAAAEPSPTDEDRAADLASLDERTRRLVNTVVFIGGALVLLAIWAPVLPALGVFDEVALWRYTSTTEIGERIVPVTLADMGRTLVIVLLAVVAVRNLPALLEILLLSRMSLSPGNRYAVKTLTAYMITAVAAVVVLGGVGLSWGEVQWLVAALGVGIGFGLQEIVANFISGIIILFERPVRVGDVVTIGDTTGVVSRVRIRATTIRNWDRQELLVPNKEFITGRLLNWTLSDNVNRIVIPVGIDYGADVPKALALLEEAAKEHGGVLNDPAPVITFEGFGDNALSLVLRCFLDSLDNRLVVVSELHQSINAKFRAAGISIAFPQRDVHLSSPEPLDVRIHSDPAGAEEQKSSKPIR